ncbi:MAG: cupin domain-containing protein [Ruminococcus sp.]
MIFNFESMENKTIPNFKGGEKEITAQMFCDDHGRIMKATLIPGASIGYHKHEDNGEVIFALKGNARVLYNDGEETLKEGECHYCPKGNSHSVINDSDSDFVMLCVVPNQV